VLKAPDKKARPDRSVILKAAALAALNSKARHASKVPVTYAEKRHVRKPRGAKPGLAVVSNEKSLMVKPAEPQVESSE
jgi:predicted ribosome quality control (RQC) complex YloA/Tae2 family protein